MNEHVFHVHEAFQVDPHLRKGPAGKVADLPAVEAEILLLDSEFRAAGLDQLVQKIQKFPALRQKLIEGPA